MKIGLAQINTVVGDLEGNVDRCVEAARELRAAGAELVVLPELAVPGYSPRDILYDGSFVDAVAEATADLALRTAEGPPVVVGTFDRAGPPTPRHPRLRNLAAVLDHGRLVAAAAKRLLPPDDVFYENRWFVPGECSDPVEIGGRRLGLLVCADLWETGELVHPAAELVAAGAEILIAPHASPYRRGVFGRRIGYAQRAGRPVVLVNLVGGQDELIFDGRSFVTDAAGELVAELRAFAEDLRVVDLDAAPTRLPADPPFEEEIRDAIVLGIRDFATKNGLTRAVLGLSGGIDSAVVAVLAAEALGAERVTAVAIPSRFTDPRSTATARDLCATLGIGFEVVPLEALHRAAEDTLPHLAGGGTGAENVQARLRAMILMSYVNLGGGLLLNTSNKSELSLGYATLYGDMAGGLCPIGDLTKPEVVRLARWLDGQVATIPPFILERPPSAELKPEQVDPFDYDRVAPELEELVRANRSNAALRRSEHKRWQMGPILKLSPKAFGSGRMMPITRR